MVISSSHKRSLTLYDVGEAIAKHKAHKAGYLVQLPVVGQVTEPAARGPHTVVCPTQQACSVTYAAQTLYQLSMWLHSAINA